MNCLLRRRARTAAWTWRSKRDRRWTRSQLDNVNVDDDDIDDLAAFLRTLDCPAPPEALLATP